MTLNELLLRLETDDDPVMAEVDSRDLGFSSVSGKPGEKIIDVRGGPEGAPDRAHSVAVPVLHAFLGKSLDPDRVLLGLGVKFNAGAGSVIAKTAGEEHLTVKLGWSPGHARTA